jgi:CO/xanthine dehydrogenase FAD-binding subunit
VLIYIGESGLDYITTENGDVIIGAATSFSKIIRSKLVQEKAPLLAKVVQHIGSPAIRNMGTIGGNLANASPAADSAVALLSLGAHLKVISENGERIIDIEAFFKGPDKTELASNELLQEIIVPAQGPGVKWACYKMGRRRSHACSVVSVAISLQIDDSRIDHARIALGAVAPVPMLAFKAAKLLQGKKPDRPLIEQAAKAAADETDPIDDARATAWYRRRICEVIVKRLLGQTLGEKEKV